MIVGLLVADTIARMRCQRCGRHMSPGERERGETTKEAGFEGWRHKTCPKENP